jgi:hypothetical protein
MFSVECVLFGLFSGVWRLIANSVCSIFIECFETLAIKLHTPENSPKANIRHSKYGEGLISRNMFSISNVIILPSMNRRAGHVARMRQMLNAECTVVENSKVQSAWKI